MTEDEADVEFDDDGYWVWDNNIDGIAFVSFAGTGVKLVEENLQFKQTAITHAPGVLYGDLSLTFTETPKAHDVLRFRRHIQKRAAAQGTVSLRDIKDVVIFQVNQNLSPFFLDFFHTPEVDHFLRCLILYFLHYIQVYEWMSMRAVQHASKIRIPGLRLSELQERQNLSILRLFVARSYSDILMGYGQTYRFHHKTDTDFSWTQRDARMWEQLLRISSRIVWIALQRRYLQLIKTEMDRMFRSENYVADKRKSIPTQEAVLQSNAGSRAAALAPTCIGDECPPDHGRGESPFYIMSPLIREITYGGHSWKLLGLGRVPLEDEDKKLEELLQLLYKTEEVLVTKGQVIGILGLPHADVDTMLNLTTKRAPDSRTLSGVLKDVIDYMAMKETRFLDRDRCLEEFPTETLPSDEAVIADLEEVKRIWRKNYHKVR